MGLFRKKKVDNQSENFEKNESKGDKKKCFICKGKIGFLKKGKGMKDINKQNIGLTKEGFTSQLKIPQGMNEDNKICENCWKELFYAESTQMIEDLMRLFNPYQVRYQREKIVIGEYIPIMWSRFTEHNTSFLTRYNVRIDECVEQIDSIDEMLKEYEKQKFSYEKKKSFNRGYSLLDNPSSLITGTLTGNAYDINVNTLKMEIQKLESKKTELLIILKNQPWQYDSIPDKTESEAKEPIEIEKSDPLDILKIRLVKGEITKKEFDEIKSALSTNDKSVQELPQRSNSMNATVPDSLFCIHCGQTLKVDAKFCGKCGTPAKT